jgi:hypothetical protein
MCSHLHSGIMCSKTCEVISISMHSCSHCVTGIKGAEAKILEQQELKEL